MEVQIAISKIKKYATSSSGDTAEVIERPNGGLSVVLADGQSSGKGAKWVSSLVVRKVIQFLADGVRDGAAARAASDALFTERGGNPVVISYDNQIKMLSDESNAVGLRRDTRPMISEIPLDIGLTVVIFTDGLVHAGSFFGESMDICTSVKVELEAEDPSPTIIADSIINHALKLERGRPRDDISIVVLRVIPSGDDMIRRMSVQLPVNSLGK